MQRTLELYTGIAVYKVHLDELREADINARVMEKKKFERLTANIAKDKRLESLPLCSILKRDETGNPIELRIISGHHRIRSARSANIMDIYVLVIEQELTDDEIFSKQLAHNALNGTDDLQVLKTIYNSIHDLDAKLRAGLTEIENEQLSRVRLEEIKIDFDFEVVTLMFLHSQKENFERALSLIQNSKAILVANLDSFEKFRQACTAVQKSDDIRNIAAVLDHMAEIVLLHYKERETAANQEIIAN